MIKPILPPDFHNEVNTLLSDISENTIGVYFLTHKDTVVYVGQSIDISNRIQQHKRSNDKIFDSFYYDECSIDELDLIEKDFIEHHKPPFNIRDNMVCAIMTALGLTEATVMRAIEEKEENALRQFSKLIEEGVKIISEK